ncbi:MAG: OmpA family protein [bacterium]
MKFRSFSLKSFLPVLILFALLFVGCGKKKEDSSPKLEKGKKIAQIENTELMAESGIPLYDEEIEDFDDSISDFAVVENDDYSNFEDLKQEDSFKIADLSQDDIFIKDEMDDVDWEDEELLALEEETEIIDDYKFKNVQFALNKYGVRTDQKNILDENLRLAKRASEEGKNLTIIGHACQLGDAAYNMPLSENRAKAIKNLFVKNGISHDKIKVIGMGQERPLVWSNETEKEKLIDDLAPNRRVEILIN